MTRCVENKLPIIPRRLSWRGALPKTVSGQGKNKLKSNFNRRLASRPLVPVYTGREGFVDRQQLLFLSCKQLHARLGLKYTPEGREVPLNFALVGVWSPKYPKGMPKDIRTLIDWLKNDFNAANAAAALGIKKEPKAATPLIAALRHKRWKVRANAAWALGRILMSKNLKWKHLKDGKPPVLVKGSSNKGQRATAVSYLISLLKDSKDEVVYSAMVALAKIQDRRAVSPLIALMNDTTQSRWRRVYAISVLGLLGDERAVPPLAKAGVSDGDFLIRNEVVGTLWSLGRISTLDLASSNMCFFRPPDKFYLEKMSRRGRFEIGIGGSYGLQLSSSRSFSGEVFGRYVFNAHGVAQPFLQLSFNGGRVGKTDPLDYGGIKAGAGLRIRWGKLNWAYSALAFSAGPAFTNKGVKVQLDGEATLFGIKIRLSDRVSLLWDILSAKYGVILKGSSDIKHDLSAQMKLAIQF